MPKSDSDHSRTLFAATLAAAGVAIITVALIDLWRYDFAEARLVAAISLAYTIIALFGLRIRAVRDLFPRWVLGAGLTLAALAIINIALEQFIGLPSPANAVVPASMMALIVLFASTSAVVGSAAHGVLRGVACAVAVIGFGMLVSCAAILVYAQRATTTNSEGFSQLLLANTTLHLTAPLLVAAVVGLFAASIARQAAHHSVRMSVLTSLAALPLFSVGVGLLVYAASLPRSARPAFVMPGMAAAAMALVCLPSFLGRPRAATSAA